MILRSPHSTIVDWDDEAIFGVFAVGTGPLAYRWFFDEDVIPGATESKLIVTQAHLEDMGSYTVEITDDLGMMTNRPPAILAVRPRIAQQPAAQNVAMGGTVSLEVTAAGLPPLSYRWTHDGIVLAGETTDTLIIPNAQPTDAGVYRVSVSHETPLGRVGVLSEEAMVMVE